MWRRIFQIPPPFRGVTKRDGLIEPPSNSYASYQTERRPTKSIHPPKLIRAPWASADAEILAIDGQLFARVHTPPNKETIRFGGLSPVSPITESGYLPQLKLHALGSFESVDGAWALVRSGPLTFHWDHTIGSTLSINGWPPESTPAPLAHGDVVELHDGAWVVFFESEGRPDTLLGPLWHAYRLGVFSLTPGDNGRWHGMLRGGSAVPGTDSLQRLKAILNSDLQWKLQTLALHASSNVGVGNWDDFAQLHLRLNSLAPFSLSLFTPLPVVGAGVQTLPAVACDENGAHAVESFGFGTKFWCTEHQFRDAPLSASGWVTLAPGDWVNAVKFERRTEVRVRLKPRPTGEPAVTPWVLYPAQKWEHRPLQPHADEWLLTDGDGATSRWVAQSEGVQRRGSDESLEPLRPWFSEVRVHRESCMVFLPAESRFLSGRSPLRADVPLTRDAVKVFVDGLLEAQDAAGQALAAIASDHHDAAYWLTRLLAPFQCYHAPSLFDCGIDLEHSRHCGGFFTTVRLNPWLDVHRDVGIFASHALMCRLERLEVVGANEGKLDKVRHALEGRNIEVVAVARSALPA